MTAEFPKSVYISDRNFKTLDMSEENNAPAEENNAPAQSSGDNGKTVALVSHFTWIGMVIGLIMNNGNKTELGSFYVRQMLGLVLASILCIVPLLGMIWSVVLLVFWIMSIAAASKGEMKEIPLLGAAFQKWFKNL